MFNGGQDKPAIEHLRVQTPSRMGPPAQPRPLLSQCVPHTAGGWGHTCDGQLDRACLSTTILIRRRNYAPLSQTCTAGACACSCKSRRAPRPRKPDKKLSRHGLGARRVALLAPRGDLDQYRYPLGYVGAITKNFGKVQKSVPHFGRRELYSEWGRSPGGEEGVSYSHVRGRQLVYSLNTTLTPSEHPRDEQHIRSPPPNTPHSPSGCPLCPPGTRAKTIKKRASL